MAFSGSIDGDDDYSPDSLSQPKKASRRPYVLKTGKTTTPLGQEAMDSLRHDFLEDLDDSLIIQVSDWEAGFMESNLSRKHFSEGQRKIIDKMRKKYEGRL